MADYLKGVKTYKNLPTWEQIASEAYYRGQNGDSFKSIGAWLSKVTKLKNKKRKKK